MTLTYADGSELLDGDAKLLKELALKLERAETGVGRTTPTTEQCRAWHKAYTTFHLARVRLEQCDAVPCPECNGAGEMERDYDGALYGCPDCGGSGLWFCEQCGMDGATVLHEKDLVCAPCADDLKQRTEACLKRLED